MNLTLVRHAYLKTCTLGYLFVDGRTFATLEEPWRLDPDGPGGQRREGRLAESCVPDGEYVLRPHNGNKWKNVWALHNPGLGVFYRENLPDTDWGREAILIGHPGNTTLDIEGCILTGMKHGKFEKEVSGKKELLDAVFDTRKVLDALREILGTNQTHELLIRSTAGTSEVTP